MSDEIQNESAFSEEVEPQAGLEDIDTLKTQLEEAQAKADEYLDGWQRARAEFANYKKRVDRDQTLVYQNATGNVIRRFLEILDDLERALKNRPTTGKGAEWADGIELIYRKFIAALEAEGVKVMDAQGQPFDPNYHEAISHEDCDTVESGKIIEVVKQGYMMGDHVLRPATVRVAK